MKDKNREALERASGIIEGVSYFVSGKWKGALCTVIEAIDNVLKDEEETQYECGQEEVF